MHDDGRWLDFLQFVRYYATICRFFYIKVNTKLVIGIAMMISWAAIFVVCIVWYFAFSQILEQTTASAAILVSISFIFVSNAISGVIVYLHIAHKDRLAIVAKLRDDHRKIRLLFSEVTGTPLTTQSVEDIYSGLRELSCALTEHLRAEDDCFYPCFLKVMRRKKMLDVRKLSIFIEQMKIVSEDAIVFFKKYSSPEIIIKKRVEFKKELIAIHKTLKERMEEEEKTVFAYWDLV